MVTPLDLSTLDGAAKDALILAQAETIASLTKRIAELEARLGLPPKTPDNSSLAPSHGHKAKGDMTSKPKSNPHKGSARALHESPTRTLDVMADACPHCATDVSGVAQVPLHRYDRIELPEIKPEVTRVVLHGGICPCCANRFKAPPPVGLEPGALLGPNARAFFIYLRVVHAVSFERLAKLASDLFGLAISEGALVNVLAGGKEAFAKAAAAIRARLLCSSILESDETSMRVGKQTWWNWVFHHADSACFLIEPSRGKDVVEAFLDGHRPDYWVSDRLAAQMGWAKKQHQVCLAHLLRDVQYAIDAGDSVFAPRMRELLGKACAIGRRRGQLADATLRSHERKLDDALDKLLQLTPTTVQGRKLVGTIKRFRQHFFVFVANRDLPATNNGSERAIRPAVTFRKVTNCFRSIWGAKLYADIRSVLETARRRGIGALHAIRLTLAGIPLPATA